MNEILKVILKELGRWLILAVVPATLGYLTELGGEFALYATIILRIVDKVFHDSYKALEIDRKGILPF